LPGPLLFIADQIFKRWCDANVAPLLSRRPILGQSFLALTRVLNRGVAGDRFSTIPNGFIEPYTRYIPTAIWALLLGFVAHRFARMSRLETAGASLLIAGGASNLWDQWHGQFVTDTLQVYVGGGQYIPFNLADLGIAAGAALIALALASQPRVVGDTSSAIPLENAPIRLM
jgi:lipoprotein signal peptidase